MRFLNIFFKLFLTLAIFGGILYLFQNKIPFFLTAPCSEPIPYNLGNFDTEFNISKTYFLSTLTDAEAIWEKPLKKELFIYAPQNTSKDILKVNLIYDYRQQATSKLASLGIVVKDSQASYDELKIKFTNLKAEYETAKNIFNEQILAFNQKQLAYEQEVKFWNKKGGAPQKEYEKLEGERRELEAEAKKLESTQARLDEMVEEINALVVVLNRLAGSLNLSVDKYNTINEARGESFQEGVYIEEGISKQIDIYEFSDRQKLVRVLAHELGHALGLGHVDDPKAIMYELNQGNTETLTSTDLEALKVKCDLK